MRTEPAAPPAPAGDPLNYYGAAGHSSEANVDNPKRTFPTFNWIYVVAAVLALATLGCGIYQTVHGHEGWAMVGAGCLGLVAVLAAWPITLCLHDASCSRATEREAGMQPLIERIDQMSILINTISEQQLLSDRAKSIAYRVKDRE